LGVEKLVHEYICLEGAVLGDLISLMEQQSRNYLEAIIASLQKDGELEINDGYVRIPGGEPILLSSVDQLISGGWLNTQCPDPHPSQGKPGHGTRLIITSPGPAWWSEQETKNAQFLAAKMETLARANRDLQIALDQSSMKFNRSMRWIAIAATIFAFTSAAATIFWMGASLEWW
jgi:hypothetical protein